MSENNKQGNETVKKPKKFDFEIKGLDIDKNEYQEIILSNSNHPDKDFYKQNYYD